MISYWRVIGGSTYVTRLSIISKSSIFMRTYVEVTMGGSTVAFRKKCKKNNTAFEEIFSHFFFEK